MAVRTHIGEGEILTRQPIRGCFLVIDADIIVCHGCDLLAVHVQPDHIRAVGCNAVFQAIRVLYRPVNAVIGKGDAIVMAACGILFAHGDDAVCVTLEYIARVIMRVDVIRGKHPCTAARGILERALTPPFHRPGLIVHQHHRGLQGVTGLIKHTVGRGAGILCQRILHLAGADQVAAVKRPGIILRHMHALGRDLNVSGHVRNVNFAVRIARGRDILAAHGDLDLQDIPRPGRQRQRKAVAVQDQLVVAIVRAHAVQRKRNRMCGGVVACVGQYRALDSLGNGIHAKLVGMQASVTDMRRIGQRRVKIHNADAIAIAHGLNGCIELLHERGVRCALPYALEMIEHINFRIGIALGDLIQHDGGRLHGGGRLSVSVGQNQRVIIDLCRTKRILAVAEIVKAHLNTDNVRRLPCVVPRVVVQLHAAVHVSAHSPRSFQQNGTAAPGIVDQQLQIKILDHLHPPSILQCHLGNDAVWIILDVISDGGIARIRCRTV